MVGEIPVSKEPFSLTPQERRGLTVYVARTRDTDPTVFEAAGLVLALNARRGGWKPEMSDEQLFGLATTAYRRQVERERPEPAAA